MPIYEYECQKCKTRQEVYQKVNDKPPKKCSKCGGKLERMVSASAIQFKGSGWYVTDYAGGSRKAAEKAESEATVTTDQKSDKSEKKTKESSPATKTSEKASTSKASKRD